MRNIGFKDVNITDGFWKQKQTLNRNITIPAVHKMFTKTRRFETFNFTWTPDSTTEARPHIFFDSDVAKWIESVCFIMQKGEYREMEKYVDILIEKIISHQDENGYFNTYFQQVEPESKFKDRSCHELYSAGHLIEAAIAYRNATGKENFLCAMCRYADYIEKRFKTDRDTPFIAPGHEEIELALFKLADATGIERYRDLAKYFIDVRGTEAGGTSYTQSHIPCRNQREAVGHAVRAGYLYSAMADIAYAYNDNELKEACVAIFENITRKRMYVTGGIGSTCKGESFTVDYDLPSSRSYAESCAAISLSLIHI